MEHLDLVPEPKIMSLVNIIVDIAAQCSGKASESHELYTAKKITRHPSYHLLQPYVQQHIEQMPSKNSNQIVQRALLADIFGVTLQSYAFDKISTKLSLPYKGWMLQRAIRLSEHHHIDILQYWIAERMVKTCTKNSLEDNLWAFRTLVEAPLSNTQIKGFLIHLNTWFADCGESISEAEVRYIHAAVSTLIEGKEYASLYHGIPCRHYQAAEQWSVDEQKYAATQFVYAYLQGHQSILPNNAIIPIALIEQNAFLQDVLALDKLNLFLLEKSFSHLNDVDTYLLDKLDLPSQFLFATARLFEVPNNNYYGIISPVVVKCLRKVCDFFKIDADILMDQYLQYYVALTKNKLDRDTIRQFAPALVLSFVKQALGQEDFNRYMLWMNTIYPDYDNFFIPAPYNQAYHYNIQTDTIEELEYHMRGKHALTNTMLLPIVKEMLQDKAQQLYLPEEINMYFG